MSTEAERSKRRQQHKINIEGVRQKRRERYLKNPAKYLAYAKQYLADHPEYRRAKARRAYARQKAKVINAYGGKCACCDEKIMEFLTIDHINGGAKHTVLL